MLPIRAWRVYYTDGHCEEGRGDEVPFQRDEIQGIVYFHDPPYRDVDHGHPTERPFTWAMNPDVILYSGDWLPDDAWNILQREMETAPWPSF